MDDTPIIPENTGAVAEQPPVAQSPAVLPPAPEQHAAPEPVAAAEPVIAQELASEPEPAPSIAPSPASEPAEVAPAVAAPAAATPAVAAATVPSAIGVLLVNLGTPEAATPAAVRTYLKEFLSDKRVIERDSLWWKFILNGVILPLRSRRKARDYEKIWNREQDESPLKTITRSQAEKLARILEPLGDHVHVSWAMRYGEPSIVSRLQALTQAGKVAQSHASAIASGILWAVKMILAPARRLSGNSARAARTHST